MPFKDREARREYQRQWYTRHREQVIADVAKRKHTLYAGICRNCGGPTVGNSKNHIPEWCAKRECARAQRVA
jgi:hypothetical protein